VVEFDPLRLLHPVEDIAPLTQIQVIQLLDAGFLDIGIRHGSSPKVSASEPNRVSGFGFQCSGFSKASGEPSGRVGRMKNQKVNIEHRTSNIERRMRNHGKISLHDLVRETKIIGQLLNTKPAIHIALRSLSFGVAPHLRDLLVLFLFDVGGSMFDVRRSSLQEQVSYEI
jgi:hypothetical protein